MTIAGKYFFGPMMVVPKQCHSILVLIVWPVRRFNYLKRIPFPIKWK